MKNKGFYIFIVDDDKKLFNTCFTYNDEWINGKVLEAQKEGRQMRCFASIATEDTLPNMIKEYERIYNYKHTEDVLW
jgi:hypothetical protein